MNRIVVGRVALALAVSAALAGLVTVPSERARGQATSAYIRSSETMPARPPRVDQSAAPISPWKPLKGKRIAWKPPATADADRAALQALVAEVDKLVVPPASGHGWAPSGMASPPGALAQMHADLGDAKSALGVLDERFGKITPNEKRPSESPWYMVSIWKDAGKARLFKGDVPGAVAAFDEALKAYSAVAPESRGSLTETVTAIPVAYAAAGELDRAADVCNKFQLERAAIVKLQADRGDLEGAAETAASAPEGRGRYRAFSALGEAYEVAGRTTEAAGAHETAVGSLRDLTVSTGEPVSYMLPRGLTRLARTDPQAALRVAGSFRGLANAAEIGFALGAIQLAERGKLAEAFTLAEAIKVDSPFNTDLDWPPLFARTFLGIAAVQARSGNAGGAAKAVEAAVARAEKIGADVDKKYVDALAAKAGPDAHGRNEIVYIAREAQTSRQARIFTLCAIARARAATGDAVGAGKTLDLADAALAARRYPESDMPPSPNVPQAIAFVRQQIKTGTPTGVVDPLAGFDRAYHRQDPLVRRPPQIVMQERGTFPESVFGFLPQPRRIFTLAALADALPPHDRPAMEPRRSPGATTRAALKEIPARMLGEIFDANVTRGQDATLSKNLASLNGVGLVQAHAALAIIAHNRGDATAAGRSFAEAAKVAASLTDQAVRHGAQLALIELRAAAGDKSTLDTDIPALAHEISLAAKAQPPAALPPGPPSTRPVKVSPEDTLSPKVLAADAALLRLAVAHLQTSEPATVLSWQKALPYIGREHTKLQLRSLVANALARRLEPALRTPNY